MFNGGDNWDVAFYELLLSQPLLHSTTFQMVGRLVDKLHFLLKERKMIDTFSVVRKKNRFLFFGFFKKGMDTKHHYIVMVSNGRICP